ncbi:MAG: DUF554 domain-containing protein [Eubacteriales bacterium]|nr:DUF554 domain-containing protein [Eubacteriales bacterium]
MPGLGTLINTFAVVAGGVLGLFFRKGLPGRVQDILMKATGLSVIFIGISGALSYMLTVEGSSVRTRGTMLLIFSLTLGSLAGELLDIEGKMQRFGEWLRDLFHAKGDPSFVEGFVNTSLVICIGAMAIVGAIEDGVNRDISMLTAKAILDFVLVLVNTSIYGKGTICSAIPIFLYQGSITAAALLLGSFAGEALISQISFIGSTLILCVGINVAFGKLIKVGNMLPSLFFPAVLLLFDHLFPAVLPFFQRMLS